jgi:hypothetical protein
MSTEIKDQAQGADGGGQSEKKSLTMDMDERIDKGFEEIELLTEQENAAKAKAKEKKEPQPPPSEEKKEPEGPTSKKPYKVLKVGGKEIPVFSKQELVEKIIEFYPDDNKLVDLAQLPADYTRKTQLLADDRRDAEEKVKKEVDKVSDATEKMANLVEKLIAAKVLPANFAAGAGKEAAKEKVGGEISDDLAKVYEEFQLDPANAYPHEKKQVEELFVLRNRLARIEQEREIERQERADEIIEKTISKERETFPFDDILDDQGNNLTRNKIKEIVNTKRTLSGIEKPDKDQIFAWLKEAVKDLHDAQKKGNGGSDVSDDMDMEDFSTKFPNLAKKVRDAAVEKEKAERSKIPPTLTPGKREIDMAKRPGQKAVKEGSKSFEDFLDEGFKDPDVIKSLGG